MKAAYLTRRAGPEELVFGDLPQPRPLRGEVLVKVHASAITPTEFNWSPTFKTRAGEPRSFPIVLGHEFSGVIQEVGEAVERIESRRCGLWDERLVRQWRPSRILRGAGSRCGSRATHLGPRKGSRRADFGSHGLAGAL